MTIASKTSPPKEKEGKEDDSPKNGGIKRSRRRSSLRDIHYANKGTAAPGAVERTRRRGSAPDMTPKVPTPEPALNADAPVADAEEDQDNDLVGEGFDADDVGGDLDGFGQKARISPFLIGCHRSF